MDKLVESTQKACNDLIGSNLILDGIADTESDFAIAMLLAQLKTVFAAKNYEWSAQNVIGVRMSDEFTNQFTDYGIITFNETLIAFPISTKPGSVYLAKPENVNGTACVVEGQYKDMWQLVDTYGQFSGDPYCRQINTCSVYRVKNNPKLLDRTSPIDKGIFGINFHSWKNFNGAFVLNLSAGCQVMDEWVLVAILPTLEKYFKNTPITYTLLNDNDFNLYTFFK